MFFVIKEKEKTRKNGITGNLDFKGLDFEEVLESLLLVKPVKEQKDITPKKKKSKPKTKK